MNAAELIGFLNKLNKSTDYCGKCVLRVNSAGAWCLHETEDGFDTEEEAIEAYAKEYPLLEIEP